MQALIFDVDGTMAETEEAHRAAFNHAFAERGFGWRWDRALYARLLDVTGGKERLRHYRDAFLGTGGAAALADDGAIIALHRRKTEIYKEMLRSGRVSLRPGVDRLLREARKAGLRLAMATTTNLGPLEALFASTLGQEAMGWFDTIVAGDMVARKKPAPEIYRLALNGLALPPAACLAIEDSGNGLLAASAAGIPTVITVSTYSEGQDFSGALAVITDLGEPDAPFTPMGGLADRPGIVDVALLNGWHRRVGTTGGDMSRSER